MKQVFSKATLVAVMLCAFFAQSFARAPKYVFYFIGDGMGVNAVQLTEMYKASLNGHLGVEPLRFSQFPVVSFGTTYSYDDDVTDSAASGTALATGVKTCNARLGLGPDGERLTSIAEMAKRCGYKVGITTSVSVNSATPAAFYAHRMSRSMCYESMLDLIDAGFDFHAGLKIDKKSTLADGTKAKDIRELLADAGYSIVYGVDDFQSSWRDADKMVMMPAPKTGVEYGIDRIGSKPEALTLKQITESAVTFLQKDNKKGFFLMVEGGDIDGAEHGHDGATMIQEVLDFNDAVEVAYQFYLKHPDETLIVVTSDHETGGLSLNPHTPDQLALMQHQKISQESISSRLSRLIRQRQPEILSWEETKAFLTEYIGLWEKVPVSPEQEQLLRETYDITVAHKIPGSVKDLYADNALVVARAVRILNDNAHIHWTTEHSSGYVPTYVIGVGQEKFSAKMDNALIPKIIAEIAKYK